jgi:WD40 repeat protein/tetratricopeptide (TPR) repeat protein
MSALWKTVRVFISSTFRDMHAERDHLVRVVFPALRARLEKHRVYLVDIDLRWGVTREQAENGQALELCLQQVDACRPFFLGLVGHRYGYSPGPLPAETLREFGLARDRQCRSITEWEIVHAVFRSTGEPARALFFFREDQALETIPEPFRGDYLDPDPADTDRIDQLKRAIRTSNYPVTFYPAFWDHAAQRLGGLNEFSAAVTEQLWQALREELDLQDIPDAVKTADRVIEEEEAHRRFIESRLQVFASRPEDEQALTSYLDDDDDRLLLVTGQVGCGKSSLLAHLCRGRSARDELLVPHLVGASSDSANLREMLRRLCRILASAYREGDHLPDDLYKLAGVLRRLLSSAPLGLRTVLVLDAVDQLDSVGRVELPHWLPARLPPRAKVIVSCAEEPDEPSELLEGLRRLKPREHRLGLLHGSQQREIVRRVPSLAAKTLDEEQVALLLAKPGAANPLYLRVALEELRSFGSFEQLNRRIADFPDGPDRILDLFGQVLERIERDLSPVTVRTALRALAVARSGLAEPELVALAEGADLQPLLRQLRPYLHYRGTQIDFYHRTFRRAVGARYLPDARTERTATARLARFFLDQPTWHDSERHQPNVRKLEELVGLCRHAEDWEQLAAILCDLDFIEASYAAGLGAQLLLEYRTALAAWPGHQPYDPFERPLAAAEDNGASLGELFGPDEGTGATIEAVRRLEGLIESRTLPGLPDTPSVRVEMVAEFLRGHHGLLIQEPAALARLAFGTGGPLAESAGIALRHGRCPWIEREGRSALSGRPVCLAVMPDNMFVADVALAADGRRAALLSLDTLGQFDLVRGALLADYFKPNPLHIENNDRFVRLAVCQDGTTAAVADHEGTVQVFELPACRVHLTLRGHTASVSDVAISADGTVAASASKDQTVRLWDLAGGGRCLKVLHGSGTSQESVAMSPDGRLVVSGRADGTIQFWDVASGERTLEVKAHEGGVRGLGVAADGRLVFSCGDDATVRVWTRGGNCLAVLTDHVGTVWDVAATPDGRLAVSCGFDGTVRVWDVQAGDCLRVLRGHGWRVVGVAVSRTGRIIASASQDRTARVWDVVGGVTGSGEGFHNHAVLALSTAPGRLVSASSDRAVVVWDAGRRVPGRTLSGHATEIGAVAVTADGSRLVSGDANGILRIWNLHTGASIHELTGHRLPITGLAAFPDGRAVVSVGFDGNLRLWDLACGELRGEIRSGLAEKCVSVTPDGRRIICPGHGSALDVWDSSTGERLAHIEGRQKMINALGIAPDGRFALTGDSDNVITVWDLVSGQRLEGMTGHSGRGVLALAVSADGALLVSGGEDQSVRVWDIATRRCLAVHHTGSRVESVTSLGPDGRFSCGTSDGRVLFFRLHNVTLAAPVVTAVRRFLFDPAGGEPGSFAGRYEDQSSLACPWCDRWLAVPVAVLEVLATTAEPLDLPCPGCGRPLRLNPFVVDRSDLAGFSPRPAAPVVVERPNCAITGVACAGGFVRLHDGRCLDGAVFLDLIGQSWAEHPIEEAICPVTGKPSEGLGVATPVGWLSADGAAQGVKQLAVQAPPTEAAAADVAEAYTSNRRIAYRLLALNRFAEILRLVALTRPNAVPELLRELTRNLGYFADHPLSWHVRAAALEACVGVGEDVLPALHHVALREKVEVFNRWPLMVNLVMAAIRIAPHDRNVQAMAGAGLEMPFARGRLHLVIALADVKPSWHSSYWLGSYPRAEPVKHDNAAWARAFLRQVANDDPNQQIRVLATERLEKAEKRDLRPWSKAHHAKEMRSRAWDLIMRGRYQEALAMLAQAEEDARQHGDKYELGACFDSQGAIYRRLGQLDRALTLTQKAELLFREINQRRDLSTCLHYQGMILDRLGRHDEALARYHDAGQIDLELGDRAGYARNAGNQAQVHHDLGNHERALELHQEEERVFQELGDVSGLAICYGAWGTVLQDQGRHAEALAFYRKARTLRDSLGVEERIDGLLTNMATVLRNLGEREEALLVYRDLTALATRMGDSEHLDEGLRCQIDMLTELERHAEALPLAEHRLLVVRSGGDVKVIANALVALASIHEDIGNIDSCLECAREAEEICRPIPWHEGVRSALWIQARVTQEAGDRPAALRLYQSLESICREAGDEDGLLLVQSERSNWLIKDGDHDAAQELLDQIEELCRQRPDSPFTKDSLRVCLMRRATLDEKGDNHRRAIASWEEARRLCGELSNLDALANATNRLAICLQRQGENDRALALYREVERLARQMKDEGWLDAALLNQATIHEKMGNRALALEMYQDEEALARRRNERRHLAFCLGNRGTILRKLGHPDQALVLHQEEEQICRDLNLEVRLQHCLSEQAHALDALGQHEEALLRVNEAAQICKRLGDRYSGKTHLGNQTYLLEHLGRLDDALDCCRRLETLCRLTGDRGKLLVSLARQASLQQRLGDLDAAEQTTRRQEEECREPEEFIATAGDLQKRATAWAKSGRLDSASPLFKQAAKLCERFGDERKRRDILYLFAKALHEGKQFPACEEVCRQLVSLARTADDVSDAYHSLLVLGLARAEAGQFDAAVAAYREAEPYARRLDAKSLALVLNQCPVLLARAGKVSEALSAWEHAAEVWRDLGRETDRAGALLGQAKLLREHTRRDGASRVLDEAVPILCRQGSTAVAAAALKELASLLDEQEENQGALNAYQQLEDWTRELDLPEQQVEALLGQFVVFIDRFSDGIGGFEALERARDVAARHNLNNWLAHIKKCRDLAREALAKKAAYYQRQAEEDLTAGEQEGRLADLLLRATVLAAPAPEEAHSALDGMQAEAVGKPAWLAMAERLRYRLYRRQGRVEEAMSAAQRRARFDEEAGKSARAALLELARLTRDVGQAEAALALYRQVLAVTAEAVPNVEIEVWVAIAVLLREQGRYEEALEAASRAADIARRADNGSGLARALTEQATTYFNGLHDLTRAIRLGEEAFQRALAEGLYGEAGRMKALLQKVCMLSQND